jgi:hypothetical protein
MAVNINYWFFLPANDIFSHSQIRRKSIQHWMYIFEVLSTNDSLLPDHALAKYETVPQKTMRIVLETVSFG